MAAVNMHMMSANMPTRLSALNHPQSRSASVSSRSSPHLSSGFFAWWRSSASACLRAPKTCTTRLIVGPPPPQLDGQRSRTAFVHVYSLPPCEVSSIWPITSNHNVSNRRLIGHRRPKSPSCPCRRITLSTRQ